MYVLLYKYVFIIICNTGFLRTQVAEQKFSNKKISPRTAFDYRDTPPLIRRDLSEIRMYSSTNEKHVPMRCQTIPRPCIDNDGHMSGNRMTRYRTRTEFGFTKITVPKRFVGQPCYVNVEREPFIEGTGRKRGGDDDRGHLTAHNTVFACDPSARNLRSGEEGRHSVSITLGAQQYPHTTTYVDRTEEETARYRRDRKSTE